jgi:hypothetical protein
MTLKNITFPITQTPDMVYSVASGVEATAHGITVSNYTGTDQTFDLTFYDASSAQYITLASLFVVKAHSVFAWPRPINMSVGDQLIVNGSAPNSMSLSLNVYDTERAVAQGFTPQGTWSASNYYYRNDVVSHDSASWVSSQDHINQTPSSSPSYWTLLADQGIQGEPGVQGIQGIQGIQGLTGATGPIAAITSAAVLTIDGVGAAIDTGIKGDLLLPYAVTITEWTLLADQSGSVVMDIWADSFGNYPPTVADSITGSSKPTITASNRAQSSTLTGWTTSLAANTTLRFNVDSASTIQRLTLILKVTRN